MQPENKPFSPFGEIFHHIQLSKIKLNFAPFLFCGKKSYEETKKTIESGQYALCLPFGKQINDFRWSIKDLSIILYDTGGMASMGLVKMARELALQEVKQIIVMTEQKPIPNIYNIKKEFYNVEGRKC